MSILSKADFTALVAGGDLPLKEGGGTGAPLASREEVSAIKILNRITLVEAAVLRRRLDGTLDNDVNLLSLKLTSILMKAQVNSINILGHKESPAWINATVDEVTALKTVGAFIKFVKDHYQ